MFNRTTSGTGSQKLDSQRLFDPAYNYNNSFHSESINSRSQSLKHQFTGSEQNQSLEEAGRLGSNVDLTTAPMKPQKRDLREFQEASKEDDTEENDQDLNDLKAQNVYEFRSFQSVGAHVFSKQSSIISDGLKDFSRSNSNMQSREGNGSYYEEFSFGFVRKDSNMSGGYVVKSIMSDRDQSIDSQLESFKPSRSEQECKKLIGEKNLEGEELLAVYFELLWYQMKPKTKDREAITQTVDKMLTIVEACASKTKPETIVFFCTKVGRILFHDSLLTSNNSTFYLRILEILYNLGPSSCEVQKADALITISLKEFENSKKRLTYLIHGLKIQQKWLGDTDSVYIQNLAKAEKTFADLKIDFVKNAQEKEVKAFFEECLQIHKKNKNLSFEYITSLNLGKLYREMQEFKKALEMYENAKDAYEKCPQDETTQKYYKEILSQIDSLKKRTNLDYQMNLSNRNMEINKFNFNEKRTTS